VSVAIGLMVVHCIGLLAVQLLTIITSDCGIHNNDCAGMGAIEDMLFSDALVWSALNGFIIYGLVRGGRGARICAVVCYGLVAGCALGSWSWIGVGVVTLLLGVPWPIEIIAILVWPVAIIVLLVCRPTCEWTAAVPKTGGTRAT
jgi:hypothetical protein